ncbi:unnamed protein product [Rhodiola kirilowii]
MDSNRWFDGVNDEMRITIAPRTGNGRGRFITLRHPKSGNNTCYILTDETLQELHWFKQSYGSWFLGDYVREDGGMYFLTPVDLIFVLLPVLEEARMKKGDGHSGNFRLLEEIMFLQGYPDYLLLHPLAERLVSVVCEIKEIGDSRFYRLDDARVLAWLAYKANQLKATLPKLDENYAGRDERDTLVDTVLIMGEYLQESWLKLLCDHLKLSFEELTIKQPVSVGPSARNGEAPPLNQFQAKTLSDKKNLKQGKQGKKVKVETNSQNIGDMFRRVTRRG